MNYTFECKFCGACGCGVLMFDKNGKVVDKTSFQQNPQTVYCKDHIPIKK